MINGDKRWEINFFSGIGPSRDDEETSTASDGSNEITAADSENVIPVPVGVSVPPDDSALNEYTETEVQNEPYSYVATSPGLEQHVKALDARAYDNLCSDYGRIGTVIECDSVHGKIWLIEAIEDIYRLHPDMKSLQELTGTTLDDLKSYKADLLVLAILDDVTAIGEIIRRDDLDSPNDVLSRWKDFVAAKDKLLLDVEHLREVDASRVPDLPPAEGNVDAILLSVAINQETNLLRYPPGADVRTVQFNHDALNALSLFMLMSTSNGLLEYEQLVSPIHESPRVEFSTLEALYRYAGDLALAKHYFNNVAYFVDQDFLNRLSPEQSSEFVEIKTKLDHSLQQTARVYSQASYRYHLDQAEFLDVSNLEKLQSVADAMWATYFYKDAALYENPFDRTGRRAEIPVPDLSDVVDVKRALRVLIEIRENDLKEKNVEVWGAADADPKQISSNVRTAIRDEKKLLRNGNERMMAWYLTEVFKHPSLYDW